MDIGDWLRSLGLGQYETAFRENSIGSDVLADLNESDLGQLGVTLGDRKRLMKAISSRDAPIAAPATATPIPPAADSAERRQLTVMFCDLVGSTAMSARLDPEDMRQIIRSYQDAVSGVVARYDGFVAKFMGDGVLAYFGFPRAHEDDAARAVHAGLEIAKVVASLQTRAHDQLSARVGIATGLVVVGDIVGQGPAQEQAVVGDTPNLAARLQGLADAGGVVLSAATRRLIEGRFRLRDLGKHLVKGLAEPVGGLGRARRVAEREPFRGGARDAARRFCRSRGRGARTAGPSAASLGRARSDPPDLWRSRHRQIEAFRMARRAGLRDAAYETALPVLAVPSRQRAASVRTAIRARGGHRPGGSAGGETRQTGKGARPRDRPPGRGRRR